MHAIRPSLAAYFPTGHAVHSVAFDAVEYLPTAHAVHVLAPPLEPVFVSDPAAHSVQSLASSELSASTYLPASHSMHAVEMLDAVEYFPAAQAVHVVAPLLLPVSVIDPPAHAHCAKIAKHLFGTHGHLKSGGNVAGANTILPQNVN